METVNSSGRPYGLEGKLMSGKNGIWKEIDWYHYSIMAYALHLNYWNYKNCRKYNCK